MGLEYAPYCRMGAWRRGRRQGNSYSSRDFCCCDPFISAATWPPVRTPASSEEAPPAAPPTGRRRLPETGLALVTALIVAAVLLRPALTGLLTHPAAANWATIFVAITIQAMPFLV